MKKEDIYLDLRELTDEQIENVFSLLPKSETGDLTKSSSWCILKMNLNNTVWFVGADKENKTEVTYEQFLNIVQPNTYPRVMEVSSDKVFWKKRVVFMEKNGKFIAWTTAETLEDAEKIERAYCWEYAREIEEVQPLELTLTEIAEKYGVSEVKIKQ